LSIRVWIVLALGVASLLLIDAALYPTALTAYGAVRIATADAMASGAAFRRHSTRPSDYYIFRFHWPRAAAAGVVAVGVALLLRRLERKRRWALLVQGLLPALVLIGGLEAAVEIAPLRGPYRPDPVCFWGMKPGLEGSPVGRWQRTDGAGFRPTPVVADARSTVLLLGDSTTFGCGVDEDDQTYGWRLTSLLAPEHVQVVNRAIPGYTSWQGLQMLRHVVSSLRPRVVVAAFMANDWTPGEVPDRVLEASGLTVWLRSWLWRSRLYLYLSSLMTPKPASDEGMALPGDAPTRVATVDYRRNFERMEAICRAHGASLVIVALPMQARLEAVSAPYRAALAQVQGARFLDLGTPSFHNPLRQAWFDPDDPIHPSGEGHAWIAEQIAALVRPLLR
jgi:lysophospholipase L1-like esterase